MTITILGNGSGGPVQGRHYTAQVLQTGNSWFLIDCGEATQFQLYRYKIRYDRFRQIFISHLHGDHMFGLVGLLTSYSLMQRSAPLTVYSPPGLEEVIQHTFRICGAQLSYPLNFVAVDPEKSERVFENQLVEVFTIPLNHRWPCSGWLFREKQKPLNIRKEKILEYDIHFRHIPKIKQGENFTLSDGTVIPNAELTLPPMPPRSFAFCSDTAFSEKVVEVVRGVNLLYHESTFTELHRNEANQSYHSSAADAARVALQAGVDRLLLGHFSARYSDVADYLKEACAIFPATEATEEGTSYPV